MRPRFETSALDAPRGYGTTQPSHTPASRVTTPSRVDARPSLRLLTLLSFTNRRARNALCRQVIAYVAGLTSLVLLLSSLAVLDAERGRDGATIDDFGDALWRSATTVTTVGYGDRFPVTGPGRILAVALMLAGIALLGVVTAAFASWLIDRVAEVKEAGQAATRRDLEALTAEVATLRVELRQAREP